MRTSTAKRFLAELSDYELLALAHSRLDALLNKRLNELLHSNQSRALSADEQAEFQKLVKITEHGSILKAQAAREAIQRGLMGAPST
ncbi:MAG: hypothetical protein CL610_01875 [Anaerolineaceae bacterium]|nr:hypothetical protein [Anaerolineaceae bacterium]